MHATPCVHAAIRLPQSADNNSPWPRCRCLNACREAIAVVHGCAATAAVCACLLDRPCISISPLPSHAQHPSVYKTKVSMMYRSGCCDDANPGRLFLCLHKQAAY